MSTAQQGTLSSQATIEDFRDSLWSLIQKAPSMFQSQFSHLGDQELCEYFDQFKQEALRRMWDMKLREDAHSASGQPYSIDSPSHSDIPVILKTKATSIDVPQRDATYDKQEIQTSSGRSAHIQDSLPQNPLQPRLADHRKRHSISSTGTGHYSIVSGRKLEQHESPPCIRLYASVPGGRNGIKFRGKIDTGHTAGASLLPKHIAEELGWVPDSSVREQVNKAVEGAAEEDEEEQEMLEVINGTKIQKLGQIDLEVEFINDDGKIFLKKKITFHIVPDGSFGGDCLLNWKLFLRCRRLREYYCEKTRIVSSLSRER